MFIFVGEGGDDRNDGTSWEKRKATLQGAELSVRPGDEVIVGPGVYRETLVCLADGEKDRPIIYTGDPSGRLTDEIGGAVRISGSDDDVTLVRDYAIILSGRSDRRFFNFNFENFRQVFGDMAAARLHFSDNAIIPAPEAA